MATRVLELAMWWTLSVLTAFALPAYWETKFSFRSPSLPDLTLAKGPISRFVIKHNERLLFAGSIVMALGLALCPLNAAWLKAAGVIISMSGCLLIYGPAFTWKQWAVSTKRRRR